LGDKEMKKTYLWLISMILIVSVCDFSSAIVSEINMDSSTSVKEETFVFTVSFPDKNNFNIFNKERYQRIDLEGFGYLMTPGKPMLPVKTYLFALPPGAKVTSVTFKEGSLTKLHGEYNILPAESIVLLEGSKSNEQEIRISEWENNHQATYFSDKAYPEQACRVSGSGTLRKYSYVSISTCPFKYYPKSKQLYYYDSIEISVNFEILNVDDIESMKRDTIADEKASNMFINYEEIKETYKPLGNPTGTSQSSYDYVIITNNELKNLVSSSDFYNWKSFLGYNIKLMTITDSEITSQPGVDLAEQIRNFLRENYISWGIKYVMIVGDYTTVPMRYCSPNPNGLAGTVPTDSYYADLSYPDSDSWDSNGDGYYGVYGQDNPDFAPEVYIGRIPTSDISRLTYTLNKITSFEQDTGVWKNNALMGGAMLFYANEDHDEDIDFDIDGARLVDFIEKDLMNGWTVSHYSEYEGLSPSVYPFDPLTEQAFTADWRNGKYAVVNWAAHGAPASIGRVIWDWDDGDGIPEHDNGELIWGSFLSTYSNLEGDYPSIVFAVSCNVGRPEPTSDGNLGIDMLTKESFGAAVAVCSSTRGAAVSADWVVSHSGAEALCYEFNHYMINGPNGPSKLGVALYDSKSYVHYNFGWDHPYEFMNMYDYNLYGDPSMIREGITSGAPNAPEISGPISGTNGEEYDYNFISIDVTDDNLYYYIEWGDGEIEEWIGPYTSGEQVTKSHSWSQDGSYVIRAKAKDEKGEESQWTILEISMPRNKPIINFLERFPIFYQYLQRFIHN
jgi:hypothetical protein